MTTEPPAAGSPIAEPPMIEERRRLPDRRRYERRSEDRHRLLRIAVAAAIAICGGLSIVYLFFAAFGAIDVEEALGATGVAIVFGLVWLGGYFVRHRQAAGESQIRTRREQERRGF